MVYYLYSYGSEHITEICNGDYQKLEQLFKKRTEKWPHPYINDECFTVGLFDDLRKSIITWRAFELIPTAVNLVLHQTKKDLILSALSLLLDVVRASNTTEVPTAIGDNLQLLVNKVKSITQQESCLYVDLLIEWYRLPS